MILAVYSKPKWRVIILAVYVEFHRSALTILYSFYFIHQLFLQCFILSEVILDYKRLQFKHDDWNQWINSCNSSMIIGTCICYLSNSDIALENHNKNIQDLVLAWQLLLITTYDYVPHLTIIAFWSSCLKVCWDIHYTATNLWKCM